MANDSDDLNRYLDSLPDKVRGELSDVIREQAQMLSDAQKAALLELEQDPEESGDLVNSCTVTEGESDLEYIVQAGGEATTREVRNGSGVGYDYALGFEFGTRHQPARPFFYNTYRAKRPAIEAAINAAVEKALSS